MDKVIKSEEKGRQREIKYKIGFTNTAIYNLTPLTIAPSKLE
ncbi:MAG: hypothetical protein FD550_000311 [Pelagibacterales bacterium]|jgi:hypothetical protein|nr:hypothetical protein [Pelagibacterales bacterium]